MNKKLLLGAALLVGMGATFTSCVDSTESPSVTAIRDAKAEQLKSIAELNKALAEKELIIANAEKAAQAANQAYQEAQAQLLAAQAEVEKAQADYLKAQAAYLDAQAALLAAQTDSEKARLEMELKEREEALKKAEAERALLEQQLEQAKADLAAQQALLQAQLDRLAAETELIQISVKEAQHLYDQMVKAAQKEEEEAEKTAALEAAQNIKKLIYKYNRASQRLITAKYTLLSDQMALAKLEAGIEDAKNVATDQILKLQAQNKKLQSDIAEQQAIINTYYQYMGEIVTQDMWDNCLLDVVKAQVAYNDYLPGLYEANSNKYAAQNDLFSSKYFQDVTDLLNSASGSYYIYNDKLEKTDYYYFNIRYIYPTSSSVPTECRGKFALSVDHYRGGFNNGDPNDYKSEWIYEYTPVFENTVRGTAELENGDSYEIYESNKNLIDGGKGLKAWLDCKLAQLKNQAPTNIEDLQKELTTAQEFLAKANEELPKAKTAYTTAVAATKTAKATMESDAQAYADAITANNEAAQAYAAAVAAYNEIENPTEADQKKLDDANAAAQAAREAVTAAYNKSQESEQAYYDAQDAETEAETAKNNAISTVEYAEAWVYAVTVDLRSAQDGDNANAAEVELWTNLVNDIIAEAGNNEANITAFNDASKDLAEKEVGFTEVDDNLTAAWDNYEILFEALVYNNGIIGGNVNANSFVMEALAAIQEDEALIEANENAINNLQKDLDKYDTEEYYNEITLATQKQIALDEAELATAQQLYDIAKAELDAALAEQK